MKQTTISANSLPVTLHLDPAKGTGRWITTLLQRGFLVPIAREISLTELLVALPGFSREFLEEKVQTIFLNGLAEDDIHKHLQPGDTLALSAAMPGLAGAIFRRGGQHASLRTTKTRQKQWSSADTSGYITLKLFNLIAVETGPELLQQGIIIREKILTRFLTRQEVRFAKTVQKITVAGKTVPVAELLNHIAASDIIVLTVR